MRQMAAVGVVLCLLGWLGAACGSRETTPTKSPSLIPPFTAPPATAAPLLGDTPASAPTRAPTLTLLPLTDAEAIALIREEIVARGVAADTVRITLRGEPRRASVRYSSSLRVDSRAFPPQRVLVALGVARVLARVEPSVTGGIYLSVIPSGEGEAGLVVTTIDGWSLEAWASNSLTGQEFVSKWIVGIVARE